MKLVVIFLVLLFILYELYFVNLKKEKFTDSSPYDYYFDGDKIFIKGQDDGKLNIGIGKQPDEDYFLDVNGTLTINGELKLGNTKLDYDLAKKINKLPLYHKNEYSLYETNDKEKIQTVNEKQLGMITGHTKIMFKNKFDETLHNLKLRHHGTHNRSDQGRPGSGWSKFNEGIQYKDLFYLHNQEPAGTREWHNTLQNKEGTTPNRDNQFQLLPIIEPSNNINLGENYVCILCSNFFKNYFTNTGLKYSPVVINKINGIQPNMDNKQKTDLRESLQSADLDYGKVKIEARNGRYCIRLQNDSGTWNFLNTPENTSYHHPINLNDPENLTLGPNPQSYFTITQTDTNQPYDPKLPKQNVKIHDYKGRILCIYKNAWLGAGGFFSRLWNAFGAGINVSAIDKPIINFFSQAQLTWIAFNAKVSDAPLSQVLLYTEPMLEIDKEAEDENKIIERNVYKCDYT